MDGDGQGRPSTLFRYTKQFEEACPHYMAMGMSYEDFWDGDHEIAKYYREAEKIKQERKNYDNWFFGFYLYEIMCDVAPMYNALVKDHTPRPYREEPFPLTQEEAERQEENRQRRKQIELEQRMINFAKQFNENFAQQNNEQGET